MSKSLHTQTLLNWLRHFEAIDKKTKESDLKSLTRLDLSNRKIETLHPDIGTLQNLSYLNLANNAIDAFPQSFDELKALISLDLRRNRLSALPEALGAFPLRSLNISSNKIESIEMLKSCKTLRTVDASKNFLHQIDGCFEASKNLRQLNLESNLIQNLSITEGTLHELEILHLSHNRLERFPKGIEHLESLSLLNLSNNLIDDTLSILHDLDLESLDLSSNQISVWDLGGLEELVSLCLDDNAVQSIKVDDDFAPLLQSFSAEGCQLKKMLPLKTPQLSYLSYASNEISDFDESIADYPLLDELDIDDNEISHLPEAIKALSLLKTLYIEGNPLEKESRDLIASMKIEYCDIFVKKGIIVRKALYDDLRQMAELLAQLFEIESDFKYDFETHFKTLRMMYQQKRGDLLVAKYHNRVIGMVTMQELFSTATGGLVGQLEDVVVDAAFRKMGVGTRLIRTAFDLARSRGYVRVQLGADRNNFSALRFYRQRGFALTNLQVYHYVGLEV